MAGAISDFFKYAPIRTRLASVSADPRMRRLHEAANAQAFRHKGSLFRRAAYLFEDLTWPLTCWRLCVTADEKLAKAVEATGLSRREYLRRQWRDCVRLRIPPREHLHFAFHEPERLARAGEFLFDIENWRLVGALNEGLDLAPLQDKVRFAKICAEYGLPTPPILALFSRGETRLMVPPADAAWRGDLFVKPRGAKAGAGMRRLAYADGLYAGRSQAEALAWIAEASAGVDLIVQPVIVNDAATARFTTGALSTARIITGRYPDGRVVAIGGFFRMARGEAVVDNISAGGLMTTIDLETGRLSAANRRWDPYVLIDRHPDTGEVFEGEVLDQWPRMLELALRGHGAFPQFAFVSWDIAPTPGGPVIIEGNHHGGTVAFQELNGAPMAETEFPDVVLAHLAS